MAIQITVLVGVVALAIYGVWRSCRDMAEQEQAERKAILDAEEKRRRAWKANRESRWVD